MAEQVQTGQGRTRGAAENADASAGEGAAKKPVLSRYARRQAEAASERAPAETASEQTPLGDPEGVEFLARSSELPIPPELAVRESAAASDENEEPDSASPPHGVSGAGPDGPASQGRGAEPGESDPSLAELLASSPHASPRSSPNASLEAVEGARPKRPPPRDAQVDTARFATAGDETPPGVVRQTEPSPASGIDPVRRVEATEVHKLDGGDPDWGESAVTVRGEDRHESQNRRVPFWKRIAMPLVQSAAPSSPRSSEPAKGISLEPVLARLNALEKQLAANQAATEGQLTRFEENITRLWELEEQMTITEVRERLALLEANQEEIADGLHTVGRNLTVLAVVLAAAVAAGLLALSLLL